MIVEAQRRFLFSALIGFVAILCGESGLASELELLVSDVPETPLEVDSVSESAVAPVSFDQCIARTRGSVAFRTDQSRFARRWDGAFEIGLNGTEGNSRNVNLVLGFDAKLEEGRRTSTIDIDYLYSRDEIETTRNRLYSLFRHEYDVPDSDWDWFYDIWFEYDPLEDFLGRIGLHVGRVATLLKTENCEFKGLVGLGATREFEGTDTAWTPEVYFGSSYEHSINDRQKFYVRSIFLPDLGNFKSFRLRIKAGWSVALNEEESWKLSLSMFDRYDSTPSGADRKNDIDYWASLIWTF